MYINVMNCQILENLPDIKSAVKSPSFSPKMVDTYTQVYELRKCQLCTLILVYIFAIYVSIY